MSIQTTADQIGVGDTLHFFTGASTVATAVRQWGGTVVVDDDHGNQHRWGATTNVRITPKASTR